MPDSPGGRRAGMHRWNAAGDVGGHVASRRVSFQRRTRQERKDRTCAGAKIGTSTDRKISSAKHQKKTKLGNKREAHLIFSPKAELSASSSPIDSTSSKRGPRNHVFLHVENSVAKRPVVSSPRQGPTPTREIAYGNPGDVTVCVTLAPSLRCGD
ncbi:hypothetical protein NL676_012647 [Syzygium grande]|nr:hypothetical protein NL676_012647 [Syzygium grande]